MPRTVEHIVATHQHAQALRDAGADIWPFTANIKAITSEDPTNTSVQYLAQAAVRIAKCLKASLPAKFFDISNKDAELDFVDLVDLMLDVTPEYLTAEESPVDAFNGWLQEIYDWCDRNRAWTGS